MSSFQSESDVKRFLDNIVNFNNLCLIWLQNKDASYVASFKTFSEMGYYLKKDEKGKGLKILVPSFYTRVKIKNDNGTYEITPLFALFDDEKKKYRDKNDDSIVYHDPKVKSLFYWHCF